MSDEYVFEGFEPANTTPVPDVLFDELLSKLNGTELKVLLYIIRRTIGFKKGSDPISLSQFEKGIVTRDGRRLDNGCGISDRKAIRRALNSLEEKKCIIRERNINDSNEYDTTTYRVRFKGEGVGANPPQPRGQIHPNLGGENTPTVGANPPQRVGGKSTPTVGANPPQTINSITINSLQETVLQGVSLAHTSSDDAPDTAPQENESSSGEPDVSYSEQATEAPPPPPAKEEKPPRRGSRKSLPPPAKPEKPDDSLSWNVEKAMAWADYFRGYAYPAKGRYSKRTRAQENAELIISRGITEERFVYVFKYMKGVDPKFSSEYWSDKEVDIWTVNDHYESQVKEIKKKRDFHVVSSSENQQGENKQKPIVVKSDDANGPMRVILPEGYKLPKVGNYEYFANMRKR